MTEAESRRFTDGFKTIEEELKDLEKEFEDLLAEKSISVNSEELRKEVKQSLSKHRKNKLEVGIAKAQGIALAQCEYWAREATGKLQEFFMAFFELSEKANALKAALCLDVEIVKGEIDLVLRGFRNHLLEEYDSFATSFEDDFVLKILHLLGKQVHLSDGNSDKKKGEGELEQQADGLEPSPEAKPKGEGAKREESESCGHCAETDSGSLPKPSVRNILLEEARGRAEASRMVGLMTGEIARLRERFNDKRLLSSQTIRDRLIQVIEERGEEGLTIVHPLILGVEKSLAKLSGAQEMVWRILSQ